MNFTTKAIKNIKTNNRLVKCSQDDDDEDDDCGGKRLGYFVKTQVNELIEIPIDEGIMSPSYYRNVTQRVRDADEGDVIRFIVNSPGGRLDGLMSLLSNMLKTDAVTEAHIDGFVDSAASMLSMHCDNIYVSPYASMLVHHVAYGIGMNKAADIHQHVTYFNAYSEQFFRDTYQHFLTDEEIQKCLDGYQLYLNAEQIVERLQNKFNILQAQQEEECQGECEGCNENKDDDGCYNNNNVVPEVKPKTSRSKK